MHQKASVKQLGFEAARKGKLSTKEVTGRASCPEFGDGWVRVSKSRGPDKKHIDHYYLSPEGKTFNSRSRVMVHLGMKEDDGRGRRMNEAKRHEKAEGRKIVKEVRKHDCYARIIDRASPAPSKKTFARLRVHLRARL